MRIGFIQTKPVFGNIRVNVEDAVEKIISTDADLLVLPELFSTGYQFKSKKELSSLAEDVPAGYTTKALIDTAKRRKLFVVFGIAEKSKGRFYNSSVLAGPKGLISVYRKAHLFWNEKKNFTPGNTPFDVHNIGIARIGMMICFDWIFPEVARILALKGADIICHPSNLVLPHCPQAMITRCLENRVFAITSNRIGTENRINRKSLRFIGKSQIISPYGEILYRASDNKEEMKIVEINPKIAQDKKITPKNDLFKDRRLRFCIV
ncbi:MAG: acyltransferase [Deltaproteobacteria bacterium]|nr:acyltransferase [Deltaproteobacteria bacterium]